MSGGAAKRDVGEPAKFAAVRGAATQTLRRPLTEDHSDAHHNILVDTDSSNADLDRFVQLERAVEELTSRRSPDTQQRLHALMSQCRDAYLRAAGGDRGEEISHHRNAVDGGQQGGSPRVPSVRRVAPVPALLAHSGAQPRTVQSYVVLHGGPMFQLADIPLVITPCSSLALFSSSSTSLGGGFAVGGCDGVVRFFDAHSGSLTANSRPVFSLFGEVRLPAHSAICSLCCSTYSNAGAATGFDGALEHSVSSSSAAHWLACGTANGSIEVLVDRDNMHPSPSSPDSRSVLTTDELSATPLNERTSRWAALSDSTPDARVVEPFPMPSLSLSSVADVEPQQQQQQRHDFPSLMAAIAAQQLQQHNHRGGASRQIRALGDAGTSSEEEDDLSGLSHGDRWSSTSSDFDDRHTARDGGAETTLPLRGPRRVNSMILSDAGGPGGTGDAETAPLSQRSERSTLSPLGEGLSPASRDLAAPGGRGVLKHIRTLRGGALSANGLAITDRITTLCAASLDGGLLFSGDRRGQCYFWDVEVGAAVISADIPSRGSITQSVLIDGNTVAIGTSGSSVLWLDRRSPSTLHSGCSAVLLSGSGEEGVSDGTALELHAGARLAAADHPGAGGRWNAALRRLRSAGGEALASLQRIVHSTTFERFRCSSVRSLCFANPTTNASSLGVPLLLCATSDGLVRLLDVRRASTATPSIANLARAAGTGGGGGGTAAAAASCSVVAAMDLKRRIRSVHVIPPPFGSSFSVPWSSSSSSASHPRLIASFEKDLVQLLSYEFHHTGTSTALPHPPPSPLGAAGAAAASTTAGARYASGHTKVCCEIRVKGVHEGNGCLASALVLCQRPHHRSSGACTGSGGDEWDEERSRRCKAECPAGTSAADFIDSRDPGHDTFAGGGEEGADSPADVLHLIRGCSGGVLSELAFYPQYRTVQSR